MLYFRFDFWTFLERGVHVLGNGGQVLGKGVQEPGYGMLPRVLVMKMMMMKLMILDCLRGFGDRDKEGHMDEKMNINWWL